jgi:hypothetical protein
VYIEIFWKGAPEPRIQHWPAAVGQLTEYRDYTVDLISEEVMEGFTVRTLSVLHEKVRQ